MVLAEEVATQGQGLKMRLKLRDLLALSTVAYLLSVLSKILSPGFYTDIIALYYRAVLPTSNGIPYHAYFLEYPAIPAILIWVSGLAPSVFYYMVTMAFLMYFFVIAAVYFLYRICTEFGMDRGRVIPFFIMAPSFLVMSFFNWDIIAVCFVIAAIYYLLRKNSRLSGFCLGLGFAAKAYPLLLLPPFMKEVGSWRGRFEMLLSTALGALIPNLPFIIIDLQAWLNSNLSARQAVYIEESIWMVTRYYGLVTQDWLITAVAWSLIILSILHMTFSSKPLVLKVWVITAVTILVYPSYPPQYDLWLLPMFVLSPIFALIPFLVFDFLNTSIILSWFTVDNPFQPWGPIWDISLIRIGLLVLLLIWATHTRHASPQRPLMHVETDARA
jgi:uncharacterized membrane protein